MARCHDCDRFIEGEDVYWRPIKVGETSLIGFRLAAYRQTVPFCEYCFSKRQAAKDRRIRGEWLALAAFVGVAFLLLSLFTLGAFFLPWLIPSVFR